MTSTQQLTQQLRQDLQNELVTANQLLRLIHNEIQQIRYFTEAGGEFESNIKQNAALMTTFSNILNIDLQNATGIVRNTTSNTQNNQNITDHQSIGNETAMDETLSV